MGSTEIDSGGDDWIIFTQGQVAGCCEYSHEPLGSIKCVKLLDYRGNSQLFKQYVKCLHIPCI
jgi:hypothetical protein